MTCAASKNGHASGTGLPYCSWHHQTLSFLYLALLSPIFSLLSHLFIQRPIQYRSLLFSWPYLSLCDRFRLHRGSRPTAAPRPARNVTKHTQHSTLKLLALLTTPDLSKTSCKLTAKLYRGWVAAEPSAPVASPTADLAPSICCITSRSCYGPVHVGMCPLDAHEKDLESWTNGYTGPIDGSCNNNCRSVHYTVLCLSLSVLCIQKRRHPFCLRDSQILDTRPTLPLKIKNRQL